MQDWEREEREGSEQRGEGARARLCEVTIAIMERKEFRSREKEREEDDSKEILGLPVRAQFKKSRGIRCGEKC